MSTVLHQVASFLLSVALSHPPPLPLVSRLTPFISPFILPPPLSARQMFCLLEAAFISPLSLHLELNKFTSEAGEANWQVRRGELDVTFSSTFFSRCVLLQLHH